MKKSGETVPEPIAERQYSGHFMVRTTAALHRRLIASRSVFIAYNAGPWTAMKRWVEGGRIAVKEEPAIAIEGTPTYGPGYLTSSEARVGRLSELWPQHPRSALFATLLQIVAEAWQRNPKELAEQDGWRHDGGIISGRFRREVRSDIAS